MRVFHVQGMGGSQMISLISVYVVYFIADDWSAVFNTIWETEQNNAMTWNEWRTGMELLLVYWMTAVNTRAVHECIASLSSTLAYSGQLQVLAKIRLLPTSAMKRIFCLMEQS